MTAPHPDAELVDLGRRLRGCEARQEAMPDDAPEEVAQALYDEHWVLREKISETPATAPEGLRAKVEAIDIALRHDVDATNRGSGSVLSLARSLCYDIAAMEAVNERALRQLLRPQTSSRGLSSAA